MLNHIVFSISLGLSLTALFVIIMSSLVIASRIEERNYDNIFWFAVALATGWSATLCLRVLYMLGSYKWITVMPEVENNGSIPFLLLMALISGILHIRALTGHKNSALWLWASLIVSAGMLVTYWVIV